MARKNPHQVSYLNSHPSSAHLYYIRQIPPGLRPLLQGEIRVAPGNRRYVLRGQRTIKLSLATSDPRLAERRMRVINGDVQRILDEAGSGKGRTAPPAVVHVAQLSPLEIKALADDYYRRLLSADDEVSTDPTSDPDAIRSWLAAAGEDVSSPGFNLAERWTTHVTAMAGIAQESLQARDLARYGEAIEVEAEDGTEIRAESAVDELLARHGITLDQGSPDRRHLANAVMMADARAWADIMKRLDGVAVETPVPATPVARGAASPKLGQVFTRWAAERKPPPKTESDFRAYINRFIEFNGDVPVMSITRAQVIAFKDALLDFPARPPSKVAKRRFPEIVAWARANPNERCLSAKTINEKILGGLSAIFGWAVANDLMEFNPRTGVRVLTGSTEADGRLPYEHEDLTAIFSSLIFRAGLTPKGGAGAAARWLPLLALFTGARLEEIGQLKTADVKSADGVHYLDMLTIEPGKKRKNNASRKRVPIHDELKRCGFLVYVAERRAEGDERLFPLLSSAATEVTAAWSKWWGRYTDKLGIQDSRKVFHSFRHLFKDALRDLDVSDGLVRAMMGHAGVGEADAYGQGYSLRKLNAALQQLRYPLLDLSHLHHTTAEPAAA